MKISACMVVYNEEKLIRRCLNSLKGVVDEIILVHDGMCSDKTLDIAAEYEAKIYVKNHIGEAEPHRPFSISKASGDWILIIDADEFLTKPLKDNLKALSDNPNVDAYNFKYEIWDNKKLISKGFYSKIERQIFFRKNMLLPYEGKVHSMPKTKGNVLSVNYVLAHRPLVDSYNVKNFKSKTVKWTKIQAVQLIESGLSRQPCMIGGRLLYYDINKPSVFYFFKAYLSFVHHFWILSKQGGLSNLKITYLWSYYYYKLNMTIFHILAGKTIWGFGFQMFWMLMFFLVMFLFVLSMLSLFFVLGFILLEVLL